MTLLMANTFNWPNAIAQTVESYGLPSRELFAQRGLPYPTGLNYSQQIELEELESFLHFLAEKCQDDLFMLRVNQYFSPSMLDSFGMALISSKNIEDALNRAINVFNFVSDSIRFQLIPEQDTIAIQIQIAGNKPLPMIKTMIFGSTQKLLQILVSPDFCFHSLDVDFALDAARQACYQTTFHCPINCNSEYSAFRFNAATILEILPGSNDELAQINEKLFYNRLHHSLENNISLQVKVILLNHLPRGEYTTGFVATQLNMPVRTLQYQLEKESTSFKKLLESTRHELAVSYLRQNKSVTEIAHLLGYTDTSNFCRAFKKWTGKSPKDYA